MEPDSFGSENLTEFAMKNFITWATVGVAISVLLGLLDQGSNLPAHILKNLQDPLRWVWLGISLLVVLGARAFVKSKRNKAGR